MALMVSTRKLATRRRRNIFFFCEMFRMKFYEIWGHYSDMGIWSTWRTSNLEENFLCRLIWNFANLDAWIPNVYVLRISAKEWKTKNIQNKWFYQFIIRFRWTDWMFPRSDKLILSISYYPSWNLELKLFALCVLRFIFYIQCSSLILWIKIRLIKRWYLKMNDS